MSEAPFDAGPGASSDATEIAALFDRYLAAYAAQDAQAVASTFAPEAHLYAPFGPPAFGRAAIAATHVDWFLDGERDKTMTVLETAVSGDMGHGLVGFAATVDGEDGQPTRLYGMSLNTLTRRPEGWLIRHCCLNLFDTPPDGFPS